MRLGVAEGRVGARSNAVQGRCLFGVITTAQEWRFEEAWSGKPPSGADGGRSVGVLMGFEQL